MNPFASATGRPGRRRLLWGLLAAVAVVHGCIGDKVVAVLDGAGAAAGVPRLEVAYVRELAPSAPPPAARPAAPPSRPRHRKTAVAPVRPASAAEVLADAASAPVREAEAASAADAAASASPADVARLASTEASAAPDPVAEQGVSDAAAASALAASAAASAVRDALAGFDWPVSTRVTYLLTGNYRGEVNGSANVEWIRVGTHYQVHFDMRVGPSFAPIITRRMTSDGTITELGLAPLRYDQETRVMGIDRPPVTLHFEPGSVVLADGSREPGPSGLQDTASQFVQLSYLFATRPELLRIGSTVEVPLALPRRVGVWTYDVVAEEPLATPFGALRTVHLKPRPHPDRPDELTSEIWFAPQLRYLPARLLIRQGGDNFLDLTISRRPELAGS